MSYTIGLFLGYVIHRVQTSGYKVPKVRILVNLLPIENCREEITNFKFVLVDFMVRLDIWSILRNNLHVHCQRLLL